MGGWFLLVSAGFCWFLLVPAAGFSSSSCFGESEDRAPWGGRLREETLAAWWASPGWTEPILLAPDVLCRCDDRVTLSPTRTTPPLRRLHVFCNGNVRSFKNQFILKIPLPVGGNQRGGGGGAAAGGSGAPRPTGGSHQLRNVWSLWAASDHSNPSHLYFERILVLLHGKNAFAGPRSRTHLPSSWRSR